MDPDPGAGLALFVVKHLHIGHPGMVIDGDMHVIIPQTARALSTGPAGHPVAGFTETPGFPDIGVDKISRAFTLVPAHRIRRGQSVETIEVQTFEGMRDGGARNVQQAGDFQRAHTKGTQCCDQVIPCGHIGVRVVVWPAAPVGKACTPASRWRYNHLKTVRTEMPNAAAISLACSPC